MPFSPGPAAAAGPSIAFPHLYNWNPGAQLINFRLARSKIAKGTAGSRLILACAGDSTTAGVGGNSGSANYRTTASMPARLTARLAALGLPATYQNFASVSGDPAADSRLVAVGSASFPGVSVFGGNALDTVNAASGFDFTPGGSQSFDRIDVHYVDTGAPFSVALGGAGAQTITPANTGGIVTKTLTVTLSPGTTVINLRGTSTADQFIQGLTCWNSTVPAVEVINGGIGGSVASSWTGSTGYSNGAGLLAVKPKLALVNFGINEAQTYNTAAATYGANVQSIVTNLQAIGSDVVIFQPTPIAAGAGQTHLTGDYLVALKGVADAQNVPLVMWCDRYQSQAQTTAAGIQYDNLHPNGNLYDDEAAFLAPLLAAA